MLTHDSTELTDPGVVPSLADRWSHHTGGTHLKVVPSHWRATRCSLRTGRPRTRSTRSRSSW
jgi:hypothetical protein